MGGGFEPPYKGLRSFAICRALPLQHAIISGVGGGYALLPILVVFIRKGEACFKHGPLLSGPFVLEKNMT